jgi:DNA-binding NtrC family response regulator
MATNADELSQTLPRRGASREAQRLPVILAAGSGDSLDGLRSAHPVLVHDGLDIGRRPPPPAAGRAALVLPDRSVSGLHARVVKIGDGFEIRDLGSTNGTIADGREVDGAAPLRSGSLIFVGSQALVFRLVTPAEWAAIEEDAASPFAPVATLSPALALVCNRLRRLAPSNGEIFLLGETGVGKEVFARAIHQRSGRRGPLVAINCAAIPRELVESELFGYEKGAHSTAQGRKSGLIEAAQGGTLFLDELGEMAIEVQSKLLRFLQDRMFTPLGSTRPQEADVRIIAASSRAGLAGKGIATGGAVQAALLGRLGAQPVQIPALRDRPEDLGRLVAYFLRDAGDVRFETEAFHALFLHDWPHNVRELQKVIAEAVLLSAGTPGIGLGHLPDSITSQIEPTGDAAPIVAAVAGDEAAAAREPVGAARTRRPAPSAQELTELLQIYRGNVAHVARHLKRQYAVVWRCIQRYGIAADEFRAEADLPIGAGDGEEREEREELTALLQLPPSPPGAKGS